MSWSPMLSKEFCRCAAICKIILSSAVIARVYYQLVQTHQLSISANYVTLLMNIICLDGLAQQLLPTYNVLDGAEWPLRLHGRL